MTANIATKAYVDGLRVDNNALIAAVESLRERVAELEKQHAQDMKDAAQNAADTKRAWAALDTDGD